MNLFEPPTNFMFKTNFNFFECIFNHWKKSTTDSKPMVCYEPLNVLKYSKIGAENFYNPKWYFCHRDILFNSFTGNPNNSSFHLLQFLPSPFLHHLIIFTISLTLQSLSLPLSYTPTPIIPIHIPFFLLPCSLLHFFLHT